MKKVIIIGGGASGFFCAANLDETKYKVTILEQNSAVLQKVKISGGGRCNVSHACFVPRELVEFYPRGNRELMSVFSRFQPGDTMAWFQARDVALNIEEDNRIFPSSNTSQTIMDTFINEVNAKGFQVKTKTTVKEILKEKEGYTIKTNNGDFYADEVVFATGSSPKSWQILEQLGHKIIPPVPSLFTFNIKDELLESLSGTSFEQVEITIPVLKASENGALLITHWGLSGPAVLKLSAWEALRLFQLNYRFDVEVNFISKHSAEAEQELIDFKAKNPKKSIGQSKIFAVTNRFWNKVLEISKINSDKTLGNVSLKEIREIINNLCKKRLKVEGKSTFKDEFVTAGGVDLKEINFKNMSSKILPNFYIAGEVLDIDAITGGFNFQACWSEAYLIAQYLNEK